jgi:hypothetical protein
MNEILKKSNLEKNEILFSDSGALKKVITGNI